MKNHLPNLFKKTTSTELLTQLNNHEPDLDKINVEIQKLKKYLIKLRTSGNTKAIKKEKTKVKQQIEKQRSKKQRIRDLRNKQRYRKRQTLPNIRHFTSDKKKLKPKLQHSQSNADAIPSTPPLRAKRKNTISLEQSRSEYEERSQSATLDGLDSTLGAIIMPINDVKIPFSEVFPNNRCRSASFASAQITKAVSVPNPWLKTNYSLPAYSDTATGTMSDDKSDNELYCDRLDRAGHPPVSPNHLQGKSLDWLLRLGDIDDGIEYSASTTSTHSMRGIALITLPPIQRFRTTNSAPNSAPATTRSATSPKYSSITPRERSKTDTPSDSDTNSEEIEIFVEDIISLIDSGIDISEADYILYVGKRFHLNRNICIQSRMQVYSHRLDTYLDIAAILNGSFIYFVSAKQYQIWEEFVERTKINDIVETNEMHTTSMNDCLYDDDWFGCIDHKQALLMLRNLNINFDAFTALQQMQIREKIVRFLKQKSKYEIERYILFNEHSDITSLASLFGLDECIIANIRYIRVDGFFNEQILSKDIRDLMIDYILDEIKWVEQEQHDDRLIITLENYVYPETVRQIRNRMLRFADANLKLDNKPLSLLDVQPFYGHLVKTSIHKLTVCDLLIHYDSVHPFDLSSDIFNTYGFELEVKANDNDSLTCLCDSNNLRHAWITHIDKVLSHRRRLSDPMLSHRSSRPFEDDDDSGDEKSDYEMIARLSNLPSLGSSKFANDFTMSYSDFDSDDTDSSYSKDDEYFYKFGFGMYLDYWLVGYPNSVSPKFDTLKTELLQNQVFSLKPENYDWLYTKCNALLKSSQVTGPKYRAKYIGVNNKKFGVYRNTKMTINHLISLKAYTDFSELPFRFKLQCRRLVETESMEDFITRNSEIAHWCRYLKECCMFFGESMDETQHFYTGLNKKLMFSSMHNFFECPISTTAEKAIAQNFSDDIGIILKLQAGNDRTTYFDTTWLSKYNQEAERLIVGSSLKICDIMFRGDNGLATTKEWIQALQLFEKIVNGYSFSWIKQLDQKKPTQSWLHHLCKNYQNSQKNKAPKYVQMLFDNLVVNALSDKKTIIWLNKSELQKLKHNKLRKLFYDFEMSEVGEFLAKFNIETDNIKWIQQFTWRIEANVFDEFKDMKQKTYKSSKSYYYSLSNDRRIVFNLQCCAKYSYELEECALFLQIKELPKDIYKVRIEYERICKECNYFNVMPPQWLSTRNQSKQSSGSRVFPTAKLANKQYLTWIIAIKLIETQ